ncbi:hypothetical protein BGZ94_005308, partial [Podila epigama]
MLALQSAPFHLSDQDKKESRFDQPFLFSAFVSAPLSQQPHAANHHIHHLHPQHQHHYQQHLSNQYNHHNHHHHHLRHHTYHHPPTAIFPSTPPALMPSSHSSSVKHQHANNNNKNTTLQHRRDSDLKQDAPLPPAAPIARSADTMNLLQHNDQTPITKIMNRIARLSVDDYAKEKIVLLLT